MKENGELLFSEGFNYIRSNPHDIPVDSYKTIIGYPTFNLFPFKTKGHYFCGYKDLTGKTVIEPKFHWTYPFKDSIARVMTDEFTYQYIDIRSELISKITSSNLQNFSEGFGLAFISRFWYYLDKKGNKLNAEGFSDAFSFKNGIANSFSPVKSNFGKIAINVFKPYT